MKLEPCRACRSMNHADSIRCLNCGAPLGEPIPQAVGPPADQAIPPAPPVSWTSMVPPSVKVDRSRRPSDVIVKILAVVIALCTIGTLAWVLSGHAFSANLRGSLGLIGLMIFAFWLWMLVDAVVSDSSPGEKVVWVLVIVFLGILGALIYAVMGRPAAVPRSRMVPQRRMMTVVPMGTRRRRSICRL